MAAGAVQMLQKSLMEAQKDLSSTDDAIKRLIGRDPNEKPTPRRVSGLAGGAGPGPERRISNGGRMRAWSSSQEGPPPSKRRDPEGGRSRLAGRLGPPPPRAEDKGPPRREGERERRPLRGEDDRRPPRGEERRHGGREAERDLGARRSRGDLVGIRSRLAGRLGPPPETDGGNSEGEVEEERPRKKPVLQSSVIATKVPPRPTKTSEDESSKKRNRRMFSFLMGTLQKFKAAEETAKQSDKERRRQEIQEKVEQIQEIEKEEAIQARKELFEQRKQQKNKIAQLAGQMATVAMYDEWNAHDKNLMGYIRTKAKPPIFYLPAQQNARTEKLLEETTMKIEEKIKKRQDEVGALIAAQDKMEATEITEPHTEQSQEGEELQTGEGGVAMEEEEGVGGGKAASDSGEASE